jgi:hypothetical protein
MTTELQNQNAKIINIKTLLDGDVHNHYFNISRKDKQTQTDILKTDNKITRHL